MSKDSSKKPAVDSALEKTVDFSESTGPVIRNLKTVGFVIIGTAATAFGLGLGISSVLQKANPADGESQSMRMINSGYSGQLTCDEQIAAARREYGELLIPLTEEWQRVVRGLEDPLLTSSERKRRETLEKELATRIDTAHKGHIQIVSEMMQHCEN